MDMLNKKIEAFLAIDYEGGYGIGFGNGDGAKCGYGYGHSTGHGGGYSHSEGCGCNSGAGYGNSSGGGIGHHNGYGDGFGDGYGYDDGHGYGIKEYEGYSVHDIDGVPTIIISLHRNIAQGFTCRYNRFTVPCFIARVGNYFAHGSTAKEALQYAQAKYNQNKPIKERIKDFMSKYPSLDTVALNSELYAWHNVLTGSCAFGRQQFAEQHGIDINNGSMSVKEFIMLTQNSYRGEIIKQLYAVYGTS